jgi:hypothetical protein
LAQARYLDSGYGYRGVLVIECEAPGGLNESSLAWMRQPIADVEAREF